MSAKVFLPGALILAVLGTAPVRAQMNPMTPMTPMGEPANDKDKADEKKDDKDKNKPLPNILTPPATPSQTVGWISPWIAYSRPDCCDTCTTGPILSEYYFRTGISLPVATGILHEALQGGWMNSVGGRSLFFNKSSTAAWTADVGLSFTYNNGNLGGLLFDQRVNFNAQNPDTLRIEFGQVDVPVSIRGYQRVSLNLAAGREWYLFQAANCPGRHWRIGADTGGRYGASRVELNDYGQIVAAARTDTPDDDANAKIDYRRLYDVFGAWFVSLHTDVEIPFNCCCVFTGGFRAEWNYNWSDVDRKSVV